MKNFALRQKKQNGYTLIELIVVLGIIGILTSVGLISFSNYNQVQLLSQTSTNVELVISQARNNARSVVKKATNDEGNPVQCDNYGSTPPPEPSPLISHYVRIVGNTIELHMVCVDSGGGSPDDIRLRTFELPSEVSFDTSDPARCSKITFESLYANAAPGELPCDLVLTNSSGQKTIKVDNNGNVEIQ